ncbi:MAG: S41 family peptidase [Planctomycetaceae bacterium]
MKFRAGIAAALWWGIGVSCLAADDAPAEPAPAGEQAAATPQPTSDEYYELMRVFVDTFEQIDRNYVKSVDRRELMEAALRGMLSKLDPYSDYIGPSDLEHFTEAVEQEFGGIGIQVDWDGEKREIEVMAPLPGSPAYAAGIHSGDHLVEIEGKPVAEFPMGHELQTAVQYLKGEAGVDVKIGIRRSGSDAVEQMTLTRAVIQLDTVLGDSRGTDGKWNFMLDPEKKIGYIRLTHFTRRSAEEMRNALQTLKEQEMKALILDLRYNPGGLLQSAVDIADMFIEEGVIVSTEGRNSRARSWYAKKFGTYSGFPMAVLVNRMSASASEILSACLQDYHRAVIVGERSWGKGSVQNVIDSRGQQAALKLTTASYHRPSGKNIHRFPGERVRRMGSFAGRRLQSAVLGYSDRAVVQQPADAGHPAHEAPPASEFVDTQLAKAVEYITGALANPEKAPRSSCAQKDEKKPAA